VRAWRRDAAAVPRPFSPARLRPWWVGSVCVACVPPTPVLRRLRNTPLPAPRVQMQIFRLTLDEDVFNSLKRAGDVSFRMGEDGQHILRVGKQVLRARARLGSRGAGARALALALALARDALAGAHSARVRMTCATAPHANRAAQEHELEKQTYTAVEDCLCMKDGVVQCLGTVSRRLAKKGDSKAAKAQLEKGLSTMTQQRERQRATIRQERPDEKEKTRKRKIEDDSPAPAKHSSSPVLACARARPCARLAHPRAASPERVTCAHAVFRVCA